MFRRYIEWFESDEELEWRTDVDEARYDRVRSLIELVPDRSRFAKQIRSDVADKRQQLKLATDAALPFLARHDVEELLDRGWGKAPAFASMEAEDPLDT